MLLAAAAVGGYQVCFFAAVRMTGVAIGTVVAIGSAPVLTGALARLTGGTRLDLRWMAATAAAVAGCAVLVTGGHGAPTSGVSPGGRGAGPRRRALLRDLRGHRVPAHQAGHPESPL